MRYTPRISTTIPDDWSVKNEVTLREPTGAIQVAISDEPVRPDLDSPAFAHLLGERFRELPGFVEHSYESATVFGGREGVLRHFRWQPANGPAVRELDMYLVEGDRGFRAAATTNDVDFDRLENQVRDVLESLSLVEPETHAASDQSAAGRS
jgi:hypothetical protein